MGYADFGLISSKGNFFANYAEFADRAIFNNGVYGGQADWISSTFNYAEIKNCRFYGESRFAKTTASKSIIFDNSFFLLGVPDFSSFEAEKIKMAGVR
jgi:hypothetical protein